MKRIVAALSVFFLAILLLCSCSAKEKYEDSWVPAGMKLLENQNVDYTLYVPEDWKIDLTSGISTAYDEDDLSSVSVVAFNLESDMLSATIDEYWTYYEASLKSTFADFSYVSDADTESEDFVPGESTVLDETAAKCYTYTCSVSGDTYQFMQCIAVRSGYVYMITYTASPANFDTHLEDAYDVISHFEFGQAS